MEDDRTPRRGGRRFVDALISERLVTVVIIFTALTLLFGDQLGLDEASVVAIDGLCVAYFLLEMILKMGRAGVRGYFASGWNRYDCAVVLLSLPVLVVWLAPSIVAQGAIAGPILRMGRLFRLFRLLQFIPNIDHLVVGIRRSLRASVGVFLALLLFNIILAVTGHFLFGKFDQAQFGSPSSATYTLFQLFTIEGWNEIPEKTALAAQSTDYPNLWGAVARGFAVITVVVGGILGLSLANAVFVDEMTMDNTAALESEVRDLAAEVRALRDELRAPERES